MAEGGVLAKSFRLVDRQTVIVPTLRTCLTLPVRDDQVLLGHKLRGFGAGKIVGIGGKVEPGESLVQAAVRELHEEAGLTVDPAGADLAAYLDFRFPHRPEWDRTSHVFVVRRWAGQVRGCEEIRPEWFPVDAPPFARMWDENRVWLPHVLRGERVELAATYGADNDHLSAVSLQVVQEVDDRM